MAFRRIEGKQPARFAFTPDNRLWARRQITKYPKRRKQSAIIPLLWRAQEQQGGRLVRPAIEYIAKMLDLAPIRVFEIATFYSMFNLAPTGKHLIQICTTTPCWLCGSDELVALCRRRIGVAGKPRADGLFSWMEVECIGACCNAPAIQIGVQHYEDIAAKSLDRILDQLEKGQTVKAGSALGRCASAPKDSRNSLLNKEDFWFPDNFGCHDDLTQITGIGKKIMQLLVAYGVSSYARIANLSQGQIARLERDLPIGNKITRENWIAQAKKLQQEALLSGQISTQPQRLEAKGAKSQSQKKPARKKDKVKIA